jgi:hypothetical protein
MVKNDYDRDRYWLATATIAGVSEQRLKSIVDKPKQTSRQGGRRNYSPKRGNKSQFVDSERISSQQVSEVLGSSNGDPLEEHLLCLILQREDLREHAVAMPPEFLHQTDNRALFTAWQSSSTLGEISHELGEELTEKAHSLTERELPPSDQARHVEDVTQCVMRLRERHFRRMKKQQTERFKELDGEEVQELLDQSLLPNENLRKVMTGRA